MPALLRAPNTILINSDSRFDLVTAEAGRILAPAGGDTSLNARIVRISEYFLGRPYVEGSLGGGPDLREELTIRLDAFDCVTYLEAVLALALAGTADEFIDAIRRIRYRDGEVDWFNRNHYMIDWARNNEAGGLIANLTMGPRTAQKTCTLDLIAGLRLQTVTFSYFPNPAAREAIELAEAGDLILFVSTRASLDVFHTGLLVEREGNYLMRHATRTASAVIEQDLSDFISSNQMAGFILLRPICPR